MSDPSKSTLKKFIIAILAAFGLGLGLGGDAAGYTLDPELAKQLGIVGGAMVCLYLHLYFRAPVLAIARDLAWIRHKLGGEAAVDADAAAGVGPDPEPPVAAVPSITTGRVARVALVRPGSVADEP